QQYIVSQERDPDGGSRRSSSGRGSRRQNQRGNPQGDRPPMRSGQQAERMFDQRDRDGDGKLSRSELPPPMQQMMERGDQNNDGAIDREEFGQMMARRRR
ncbi:MAG: EF-hand domain-containing protein, partial [Pirellulaceae bacterium]|nr:EF-hand domain-containing protein [Pirellulaceae bacterium]